MARRKGRLESSNLIFAPITTPTATVLDFAGTVAPSGWLLCDGSEVSRTIYATLFATISTIYGVGNGTTTFNLPDTRGRVAAGRDNMGGVAANRITPGGSGITGTSLGSAAGTETYALNSTAYMPAHNHGGGDHAHSASSTTAGGAYAAGGSPVGGFANGGTNLNQIITGTTVNASGNTISLEGGASPHQNTQPTIILNKIIKI